MEHNPRVGIAYTDVYTTSFLFLSIHLIANLMYLYSRIDSVVAQILDARDMESQLVSAEIYNYLTICCQCDYQISVSNCALRSHHLGAGNFSNDVSLSTGADFYSSTSLDTLAFAPFPTI